MTDEHDTSAPDASGGSAATELDAIRSAAAADPTHAYNDRRNPGHKAMHARVLDLTRQSTRTAVEDDDDGGPISSARSLRAKPAAMPAGAQAAQTEIDAIKAAALKDPNHPYNDKSHPEHKALHQRMLELYQTVSPGGGNNDDDDVPGVSQQASEVGSDADFNNALRAAHIRATDASVEGLHEEFAGIKSFFADAEISAAEANEVIGIYNESQHLSDDQLHDPVRIEQQVEGSLRALEAVWKADMPAKLAAAQRAVEQLDRDGMLTAYLEETRLGDDPRIIKMLADVATRRGW